MIRFLLTFSYGWVAVMAAGIYVEPRWPWLYALICLAVLSVAITYLVAASYAGRSRTAQCAKCAQVYPLLDMHCIVQGEPEHNLCKHCWRERVHPPSWLRRHSS